MRCKRRGLSRMNVSKLARYGDMLAIPFWIALIIYFYKKEKRTPEEDVYFAFVTGALIADTYFVVAG